MLLLSIDTETTGLFIHKGCRAFILTATSIVTQQNYYWRFYVNPFDRSVTYDKKTVETIRKIIKEHKVIVFHNANFDMQVLDEMGFPIEWFFENFDVHDTMLMSYTYKTSNRHGLKENCIQHLDISDLDEDALAEATKQARTLARKRGWYTCEEDSEHEALLGTDGSYFKADYWVPYQIAEELDYPTDHPWRVAPEKYATKDSERTAGLFLFYVELLTMTHQQSQFKHYTSRWTKKFPFPSPQERSDTAFDKYNEARQLLPVILKMERQRVPVINKNLDDSVAKFTKRKAEVLQNLKKLCGDPNFNPDSHPQLKNVLFNKFKFKPIEFGKTGEPSSNKTVISKLLQQADVSQGTLEGKYEFLITLKEFRKVKTTLSYCINYKTHSLPSKHKSHSLIQPLVQQTRTGTGRLSVIYPNTTNVGKKDTSNPLEDMKDKKKAAILAELLGIDLDAKYSLRSVFGPLPEEQWTCIDYDQFQLRIFAVVSESDDLIKGFELGKDIHSLVAKIIFQKDDIDDVERTAAKAINFGLLFGAGKNKIEKLAGVPGLYDIFMANFPRAKKYLDRQSALAKQHGYVFTVGGTKLYVPPDAPYAASCYVIQGTEAEIVRMAMTRLPCVNYALTMMVHDELIFTSDRTYWGELNAIMKTMEDAGKEIGIPCKVDAKITNTTWSQRDKLVRLAPKRKVISR
jgi:DNA polymerase I-like protein with 3'-5' exonuclease and polymerase domains